MKGRGEMKVGRRRRNLAPGVCVYAREKPPFPEDWEGIEGDALGLGNQMVCLFGWSESARDGRGERDRWNRVAASDSADE